MRTLMPARTRALHERMNDASLPELCVLELPTGAYDGEGGYPVDWAPSASLPCRVSPVGTSAERVVSDQIQAFSQYLVTFGRAVAIPLEARLRIDLEDEVLLLNPQGSNGPRSFEAQRQYVCNLWRGSDPVEEEEEEEQEL